MRISPSDPLAALAKPARIEPRTDAERVRDAEAAFKLALERENEKMRRLVAGDVTVGSFSLPYPPSGNRYWRHVGAKVLVSKQARDYRKRVAAMFTGINRKPETGLLCVTVNLFRPAKRGDLDNSLKVLLDALRGCAFVDDSQVVEIHAHRHEDPLKRGFAHVKLERR